MDVKLILLTKNNILIKHWIVLKKKKETNKFQDIDYESIILNKFMTHENES